MSTQKNGFLRCVNVFLSMVFLWTNCVWAGEIQPIVHSPQSIETLAAQSQLTDVLAKARVVYTGTALHSTLITEGITELKDLYQNQDKLREKLRKSIGDAADNLKTLIFESEGGIAYYTFSPEGYFYRFTTAKEVNDHFNRLIEKYAAKRGQKIDVPIGESVYYQETIEMQSEIISMVDACLEELYPDGPKNISKFSGIPVGLNLFTGEIVLGKDVAKEPRWKRPLSDTGNSIADPSIIGQDPERVIYYGYRNVRIAEHTNIVDELKLRFDITVLLPGLVGEEFIMTKGHIHPGNNYPEFYEVWNGTALYVQQGINPDTGKFEVIVTLAKPGDKILLIPGYSHRTINISSEPLVMANWISEEVGGKEHIAGSSKVKPDFSEIEAKNGYAYHVAKSINGDIILRHNPKYGDMPADIRFALPAANIPELGLSKDEPVYLQYNNEKLAEFLRNSEGQEGLFKTSFQFVGADRIGQEAGCSVKREKERVNRDTERKSSIGGGGIQDEDLALANRNFRDAVNRIKINDKFTDAEKTELEAILEYLYAKAMPYFIRGAKENPVYHNTQVLDNMVRIGLGENLKYDEFKLAVILALLHDIGNADCTGKKVKNSEIKAKIKENKLDEAIELARQAIKFRLEHMEKGPGIVRLLTKPLMDGGKLNPDDIKAICEAVNVYDYPSIEKAQADLREIELKNSSVNLPDEVKGHPGDYLFSFDNTLKSRLIEFLREADRLFMVIFQSVVKDLKDKKEEITEPNIRNKLAQNKNSHREEYGLYKKVNRDDGCFLGESLYRTKTGYAIFEDSVNEVEIELMLDRLDSEGTISRSQMVKEGKDTKSYILENVRRLIGEGKPNIAADILQEFSRYFNYLKAEENLNELLVRKSEIARNLAVLIADNDALVEAIKKRSFESLESFINKEIEGGRMEEGKARAKLETAKKYITEWLDKKNNIPVHIRAGIIRGMLEGRDSDLLFAFGEGWRKFGTAGIRNPAVASEYMPILDLELQEFAENSHAPILTGPNMINMVTILQQEAAIAKLFEYLIENIDNPRLNLSGRFKENIRKKKITIAYDSRLNGEYFAKMLACAFLRDGINVDLFDNAAGMPALVYAADRMDSAFGFLISASHSEANYNGFKAVLGHLASQLDASGKDMVMQQRAKITYKDMHLDLAEMTIEGFEGIMSSKNDNLRWLGSSRRRSVVNYCNAEFMDFYTGYYAHVAERSPLANLDGTTKERVEVVKRDMQVFYTAFYGVGAIPAGDFPGFIKQQGYGNVSIVKKQTEKMDGRFEGHYMPDPGVVSGWVVNLVDFLIQEVGEDLRGITDAIEKLNNQEAGVATDPDIDRAGMMLSLPPKTEGNIKKALIKAVDIYLSNRVPQDKKDKVIAELEDKLNDKYLLTANDAWAFMAYYQLRLLEEKGLLRRDRIYFIEESHVTTPALERIAQLFRDKGYRIYVIQTYVGFTELAKKSRDLFTIAEMSNNFIREYQEELVVNRAEMINKLIVDLERAYKELRSNVPSGTNEVPEVKKVIEKLKKVQDETGLHEAIQLLQVLSNMEVLYGVEESNGYGEFGRFDPAQGKVIDTHICEKDGSLAAFKFLEIIAYGKLQGQTGYEMFGDMIREIGHINTDNRFLPHPGLKGNDEKEAEVRALEKIFAYVLQRELDNGKQVYLFNGKYTLERVEIYRDGKYDDIYKGFPEEGVRLYLKTRQGSDAIVTLRPSGTGDTIRSYAWILGKQPGKGVDLEDYRRSIHAELEELARDFFGDENLQGKEVPPLGYVDRPKEEFHGLLAALKEGGRQRYEEVFAKVMGLDSLLLSKEERDLIEAAGQFAFAARKGKKADKEIIVKNNEEVEAYLNSDAVQTYLKKIDVTVSGNKISIPNSAFNAWKVSFDRYLASIDLMRAIDHIMRMLKIEDYPRIVQVFNTSIDPVALVNELARISGRDVDSVLNTLRAVPFFSTIALDYRVRVSDSFKPSEYEGKKLDIVVDADGYRVEMDRQGESVGEPLSDYISAKRAAAESVPFAFRDEMDAFVGRFLGMPIAPRERPDFVKWLQQVVGFFLRIDLNEIKYVITSGIGANEMYSHELAQVVNAYFGGRVRWIVVNNPAHLDPNVIPSDANNSNTVVFEMSRSGSTQETVDFFNATRDRFKKRIVAANSGALQKAALELSKDPNAVILNIDDIPGDIGGRQMNRKTLMVYVPLFMALLVGTRDVDKAKGFLREYVQASLESNTKLAYSNGINSEAVRLSEFLLRQRTGAGRIKFALVYDQSLKATSKELFQLLNEGANKNIAGSTNRNILDSFSLNDREIYDVLFTRDPNRQMPIFLLNRKAANYNETIGYINQLRARGIPCIVVAVDLDTSNSPNLTHNLRVLARTSNLLQDMVVYFTYLTNQDANSNPAVKFVREITAAIFEILKQKKESGAVDIRITLRDVMAKIQEKRTRDQASAKQAIDKRGAGLAEYRAEFNEFRDAIDGLVGALGINPAQLTAAIIATTSKSVVQTDVGEAGGSKIAEIVEAFSRAVFSEILGTKTQDPKVDPLEKQIYLPSGSDRVLVSVAVEEDNGLAFRERSTLAEKIADYLYAMYTAKGRRDRLTHMPLICMEADQENPIVREIIKGMVDRLADLGISCPKLALPGAAHAGIEAVMSHPENIFVVGIVSTKAYGGELGSRVVEGQKTIDDATYVYGIGNVVRMTLGGSPSVIFEITDSSDLEMVRDTISEAIRMFKDKITRGRPVEEPSGSHIVQDVSGMPEGIKEVPIQTMKLSKMCELEDITEMPQGVEEKKVMFNDAMKALAEKYEGLGIFMVTDQVEIVRNLRADLYRQGRAPLAVYVTEGGVRKLKIDESAFVHPRLLYEELEHEFSESVARVVPGSNPAISDVVATVVNVRGFLGSSVQEQDEFLDILEQNRRLDPDGEYKNLLTRLRGIKGLSDDELITSVVRYVLKTKLYEHMRRELGLQDELAVRIRDFEPRVDDALAVFNEVAKAKQGKELVEKVRETEEIAIKVIKTFTGVRIQGLEGLSKRLSGIIAGAVKISSKLNKLSELFPVTTKEQFCIVLNKESIPKEMLAEWDKEVERLRSYKTTDNRQLFEVVYSLDDAQSKGYKGKNIIHLVDPADLEEEMPNGILYLPMPYLRSSLYIAGVVVIAGGEVARLNSLVKGLISDFYSQILGRSITDQDLMNLFNSPWLILPEIKSVLTEINNLRKAIVQIEKAA